MVQFRTGELDVMLTFGESGPSAAPPTGGTLRELADFLKKN